MEDEIAGRSRPHAQHDGAVGQNEGENLVGDRRAVIS